MIPYLKLVPRNLKNIKSQSSRLILSIKTGNLPGHRVLTFDDIVNIVTGRYAIAVYFRTIFWAPQFS